MRSAATAASTTAQKAVADTAKNASAAEQMSQCAAMRAYSTGGVTTAAPRQTELP